MERKGSPHAALVHLLQEGSIALPAVLFSEYKRLGLNEGQVMLLLHLMVFQEKEGKSFPTVSELEERMSVPADQIVSWLQSLVRGGFLKIEEEIDWAGLRSERYDSLRFCTSWPLPFWTAGWAPLRGGEEAVYQHLFRRFEEEFGRPLSPMECEMLTQWVDQDGYSEELILAALREAVFSGKASFRYIDRILLEWQRNRIRNAEEAAEYSRRFRQRGFSIRGRNGSPAHSSFTFYNWVNQE